jgi:hypothetical protein
MSLMDEGMKQCTTCGYYGDRHYFVYEGIESMCTCAGCLAEYDERRSKITPREFK